MSKGKGVLFVFIIVLLGCVYWLLQVRSYDLRYTFEVKTTPEIAFITLKAWAEIKGETLKNVDLDKSSADQTTIIKDAAYHVRWTIKSVSDSASLVTAEISGEGNVFYNRVMSYLMDTPIKTNGEIIVREILKKIKSHLNNIKVNVEGVSQLKRQWCLCIANTTSQYGKAGGMMKNFQYLSNALIDHALKAAGNPLIRVISRDRYSDKLAFDFCYPVDKKATLINKDFYFEEIGGGSAIKANYYGNYITSDRAWYALIQYAQQNHLEIEEKPVEIFHNNPNIDSNEADWLAEIYMPIITKEGK